MRLRAEEYISTKLRYTRAKDSRSSAALLDIIFALFNFAPWNDDNTFVVKIRDDIFPPSDFD